MPVDIFDGRTTVIWIIASSQRGSLPTSQPIRIRDQNLATSLTAVYEFELSTNIEFCVGSFGLNTEASLRVEGKARNEVGIRFGTITIMR